eukprot:COSAG01_NODE_6861_length_3466_cov_2.895456_2_plen_310_part_00
MPDWMCMNYVLRRSQTMSNTSGELVGTVFRARESGVDILPQARTVKVDFAKSGRAPKLQTGGLSFRLSTGGNVLSVKGGYILPLFGNTCPVEHAGCWVNTTDDADYHDYELWFLFSADALNWTPRAVISNASFESGVSKYCRNPCENHMVRLSNGSILVVFRSVGTWHPLCSVLSSDEGSSFSQPQFLPAPSSSELVPQPPSHFSLISGTVWGVEPKMLKLENGLLVLSTGRGGLMLWATTDPPTTWVPFNLATHHNQELDMNSSYFYNDPYPLVYEGESALIDWPQQPVKTNTPSDAQGQGRRPRTRV